MMAGRSNRRAQGDQAIGRGGGRRQRKRRLARGQESIPYGEGEHRYVGESGTRVDRWAHHGTRRMCCEESHGGANLLDEHSGSRCLAQRRPRSGAACLVRDSRYSRQAVAFLFFFFKQKTAYEMIW